MTRSSNLHFLGACCLLLALNGCGFGTAGVASAVGGGGAGVGNAASVISDIEILRSPTSPASITFRVTDQESDPVDVEIFYKEVIPAAGDGSEDGFAPIATSTPLEEIPSNQFYTVLWDFADETNFGDESYHRNVEVKIVYNDSSSELTKSDVEVGNDPPEISVDDHPPTGEDTAGNAEVVLTLEDTAADRVRIRVEYNDDFEHGYPDTGWKRTRPAGLPDATPTPEYSLEVEFPQTEPLTTSVQVIYIWESDSIADGEHPQLGGQESDVLVRLTPEDEFISGDFDLTGEFHIDNNGRPLSVLDEVSFLLNSDQRRGIPVPFSVFDDESDRVRVVLQWRRDGQPFPDLSGESAADLIDLIEDPAHDAERKAKQIGRQVPRAFTGRVGFPVPPLSANEIRLPELGSGAAALLAPVIDAGTGETLWRGIAGKTLEILRPDVPEEVSWSPPIGSVAAVAREGGLTALVLDADAGGWRVREIDLTTGSAQPFAAGPGAPRAMSADSLRASLFVASDAQVFRFDYDDGAARGSIVHTFLEGPRGLAALGSDLVVATGDDSLVGFGFVENTADRTLLVDELDEPWGVVADPLRANGLYVAERGAHRVVALDLDALVPVPLAAGVRPEDVFTLGALPFPSPRALALERSGERLLVLSELAGSASLRGLDLRSPIDVDGDALADPFVFAITDQLGQTDAGLATGADGLRVVSMSSTLALGGGVEQVRTIVTDPAQAYDPETQGVALETGFDPMLAGEAAWRVRDRLELAGSSPTGVRSTFVWDSSEVLGGGTVQVRVLPVDDDPGISAEVTSFKAVSWGLDVEPVTLAPPGPFFVAAGDFDGDGDLDLVSANSFMSSLTLFFQTSPGEFTADPAVTLTDSGLVFPTSLTTGDLDGDGDLDIVSSNVGSSNLTIFFQERQGLFNPQPTVLGGFGIIASPQSVATADLDGDGDLDIVSANSGSSDNLTIFFQEPQGVFNPEPGVIVGGTGITDAPQSVATADLDGDGDLDLVSANLFNNNLTLFLQVSPGVFDPQPAVVLGGPEVIDRPESVATADLDGDGDLDIVSANRGNDNLTLFFQTSPGQFDPQPVVVGGPGITDAPQSVATADFDGDGDLDIVAANVDSNNLTIFFQSSQGVFTVAPAAALVHPSIECPQSVAAGDLDGDGDMDLVSASNVTNRLTIYLNTDPGQFTVDPAGPLTDPSVVRPGAVAAGDLDGDGDLDIVSANRGAASNSLRIFFQTRPGLFTVDPGPPLTDPMLADPQSVAAADLDGDGDLDIVSANEVTDNLTIFFQTSPGQFDPGPEILGGPGLTDSPVFVTTADLDGDGDPDIVTANDGSDSLRIFFQTSPGQFDQKSEVLGGPGTTNSPASIATGDLDGDGDLDIVSANAPTASGGSLTLFLQTPEGSFEVHPDGPLTDSIDDPRSVAVNDLDGDGDLDIVCANFDGNDLTLFFQTSPGQFTGPPTVLADDRGNIDKPRSVAAGDLDGDGDVDLVSANSGTVPDPGNLTLFLQTSPGQFDPRPAVLGGIGITNSPQSVVMADLDGDGDPDIVSANLLGDDLTLFFGIH